MKDFGEVGPGDLLVFSKKAWISPAHFMSSPATDGLHVRADALHHEFHCEHVPISAKLAHGDSRQRGSKFSMVSRSWSFPQFYG